MQVFLLKLQYKNLGVFLLILVEYIVKMQFTDHYFEDVYVLYCFIPCAKWDLLLGS